MTFKSRSINRGISFASITLSHGFQSPSFKTSYQWDQHEKTIKFDQKKRPVREVRASCDYSYEHVFKIKFIDKDGRQIDSFDPRNLE